MVPDSISTPRNFYESKNRQNINKLDTMKIKDIPRIFLIFPLLVLTCLCNEIDVSQTFIEFLRFTPNFDKNKNEMKSLLRL